MIFSINQNSTLPILHMQLINDGRVNHQEFHDCIQNADVYFSMWDADTGKKVISCKKTNLVVKKNIEQPMFEEYFLTYKFSSLETKKPGVFVGEFKIEFKDDMGTLIVPIQDELKIHIVKKSV